ncbi:MAG: conserved rane protein of unknown function [Thermomicrobiales bacterium]|jgi:hypothetical protein|nr:conserved rane protein of unknown function [Thermomicrobiales bacterium]MDF2758074.1 conserved rane protein of unknown function [Thermomicrobiales bacterium]MDF3014865.1 conserved rane protein of unknown function [Thermomicrobiales bacterium]
METAILTGIGLAAPAGLNAYIPLLALALADRATTRVTLHAPYDVLSSNLGIAILIVLLTVEVTVDKIPGVDHINDLIQSLVRPAAGAVAALAATGGVVTINPAIMVLVGVVLAGSVNAVKVTTRPAVTLGTAGILNPVVSLAEDAIAVLASVVAIFLPFLVILILALFAVSSILLLRRFRRVRSGG